jgi:uncharacterized protein YndB with AHSA1/START domain
MAVVEESIVIPRTPQEVFDYVSDPRHITSWDNSIMEAEELGTGERGVGTRTKGVSKILGRRFPWVTEYVEYDRPSRLSFRTVEGPLHFTVTERLDAEDGGRATRFTWRVDADPGLGGVFGKLADPFVERAQARTVRNNLETLAEILTEHQDAL